MAHPTRFERVASTFGGWRSIQLSYGCLTRHLVQPLPPRNPKAVGREGMGGGRTQPTLLVYAGQSCCSRLLLSEAVSGNRGTNLSKVQKNLCWFGPNSAPMPVVVGPDVGVWDAGFMGQTGKRRRVIRSLVRGCRAAELRSEPCLAAVPVVSSSYFHPTSLCPTHAPATSYRSAKRRTATALFAPERAAVRDGGIAPCRYFDPPVLAVTFRQSSRHLLMPSRPPPPPNAFSRGGATSSPGPQTPARGALIY